MVLETIVEVLLESAKSEYWPKTFGFYTKSLEVPFTSVHILYWIVTCCIALVDVVWTLWEDADEELGANSVNLYYKSIEFLQSETKLKQLTYIIVNNTLGLVRY